MRDDKFNLLLELAETALKEEGLVWQRVAQKNCKHVCTSLHIRAGVAVIEYSVRTAKWHTTQKDPGVKKSKGVGIYSAMKSAKSRLKMHKERKKVIALEKKRVKRYNKETEANLLFKLKKAEQYFDEGNSASKAARMATAEYRAVKEHLVKLKKMKG